jgi:hypothetical protein
LDIYIYIYLSMTESFGKRGWNGFMIFWNVRTRLQGSKRSTYVDRVSRLSRITLYVNEFKDMFGKLRKWQRNEVSYS